MDAPSTASSMPAASSAPPRRIIRGPAAIVGGRVIAVVPLVALVLASNRGPAVYPVGGPEASFQRCIAAWEAGDYPSAYAVFSLRIHTRVTLEDYRANAPMFSYGGSERQGVVLPSAKVADNTATLDLRVEHPSPGGGLGGGSSWSNTTSVAMAKENGAWYVDDYPAGVDPLGYTP